MPAKTKRPSDSVAKLRGEVAERDRKISELEEKIRYLMADFENYKKQLDKERSNIQDNASQKIIQGLLSYLDDMEQAIERAGHEKPGLELLHKKIVSILKSHNLRPIEAKGKQFDPYYHEAIMSEKSDARDGMILEEFQRGYMLNSSVIRHSKVKVAKK
jgi:molecular chaperone GrpE